MQNKTTSSYRPSLAAFCFGRNNLTTIRRNVGLNDCFINKQNRFLRFAHNERDERRQYYSIKEAAIRIQALWRGIMARRQLGDAYRTELECRLRKEAVDYSLTELRLLVWKFSVYYECPRDTAHLVLIVKLLQQHVEEVVNDFRWSVPLAKLIHSLTTSIASLSEAPAVLPLVKQLVETKRPGCILRLLKGGIFETMRTYVEKVFTVMTKEMRCENESFNHCVDCIGISLFAAESFEKEEERIFVYKDFFNEFFRKKSQRIISDFLLPTLATKWKDTLLKALSHAEAKCSVYTALSVLECIRKLQVDDSLLLLRWREAINKLLCMSLPSLFDIFHYKLVVSQSADVHLPSLEDRSEDMDEPMLDTLVFLLNDESVVEYLTACFEMAKNDGRSRQYGVDLLKLFYKISTYAQEKPRTIRAGCAWVDEEAGDDDGDRLWLKKSNCMQLVSSLANDISLVPFFWRNAVDCAYFDESGIVIPNAAEERENCLVAFGSTCVLLTKMFTIYFDSDFVSSNVALNGRRPSPLAKSDVVAFVRVLCKLAQAMIYDSCSTSYGFPNAGDEACLASQIRATCLQHAAQWDDIFIHIVNVLWNLKQRDDRLRLCESNDWTDCDCKINEVSAQNTVSYAIDGRLYAHMLRLHIAVAMNKIHSGYFVSLRNQTILSQIPFAVPFEERLSILRAFIEKDRALMGIGEMWIDGVDIKVRRGHMFQDAYAQLKYVPTSLFKGPIRVVMYNSASVPEVGVDGGGIFREFMTEVLKQGFSADYGFFLSTQDESELYPNWANEPFLGNTEEVHYFFGRLVGKAIYEELQVEPRFALFYLAAILYSDTKSVDFNYLSSYNRTVYNSLRSVANYEGNFENLHLDFSIMSNFYGEITRVAFKEMRCTLLFQTFELIPGGANVRVVKENRREYVQRVAEFFQVTSTSKLIAAFRRGLTEMISFKWLSMFSPAELQIVISGFTNSINVVEWQSSTLYEHTSPTHPVVISFWRIVEEMTETEKSRLLRFVTSCSRPPLLGFASFRPLFTIQVLLDVTDRLPTSATCVNLLKLPNIPDALTLKEKLLFAIQSSSGFELC